MDVPFLALGYLFMWTVVGLAMICEGYGLWSDDPYPFFSFVPGPWDWGAVGARTLGGMVMWVFWWPLLLDLM